MDHSEEARARRAARVTMRRAQRDDPLAERVRIINFWRACSETNRHYLPSCGAWWRPFITQPGLRRHLMPKLRARIEAKERAWREKCAADMRESSERFAKLKAERAAAKVRATAPQRDLLDEVAAC